MARLVLIAVPALLLAAFVGLVHGWRWVFAPLLGWALLTWILGSLRALVHDAKHLEAQEAEATPVSGDERTLFWCEECGTEVLLLVRGTSRAPSHCGQRMHERTELLH
ncbi:hypothetical protein FTX61_07250 [Nitriliruptoraceae bacterium ZYF776]|nr:hypothetical protein [Profundirhabdus halotolerans]